MYELLIRLLFKVIRGYLTTFHKHVKTPQDGQSLQLTYDLSTSVIHSSDLYWTQTSRQQFDLSQIQRLGKHLAILLTMCLQTNQRSLSGR